METGNEKWSLSGKKDLLKRLMQDSLTEKERSVLLTSFPVVARMRRQWESVNDIVRNDCPDESLIWRRISKAIKGNGVVRRMRVSRIYAWVASLAVLLSLGGGICFFLSGQDCSSEVVISSDMQRIESVLLPDGTKVRLGSGSRLTYPAEFTGKTREVVLDGQAFFEVAKNPRRPFIVRTEGLFVQALGTAFEVFGYRTKDRKEVILLNGKVKVGIGDGKKQGRESFLVPDEQMVYDRQTDKIIVRKVDAGQYTAWRDQEMLIFENERLSTILPRLEQWYGCKVTIRDDLSEKYRFTFKVRDESLEQILRLVTISSPLSCHLDREGNYVVTLK